MQLVVTSSLQGLLWAPYVLDLCAPMLTPCCRLMGPPHSPTLLREMWLHCCMALLRLQISMPALIPCCALGLYSAFVQLYLIGWHWGSTDLALCIGGHVCFVERLLFLAVYSCMQLVSLLHGATPGQCWASQACDHSCCKAKNWLSPHYKV